MIGVDVLIFLSGRLLSDWCGIAPEIPLAMEDADQPRGKETTRNTPGPILFVAVICWSDAATSCQGNKSDGGVDDDVGHDTCD